MLLLCFVNILEIGRLLYKHEKIIFIFKIQKKYFHINYVSDLYKNILYVFNSQKKNFTKSPFASVINVVKKIFG